MESDFLSNLECPQFVDFISGIEEQDDTFFDVGYPRHDALGPREGATSSNQSVATASRQSKQSNKSGSEIKGWNLATSPKLSSTPKKDKEKTSPFVNYAKRGFRNQFTSSTNRKPNDRRSRSVSPSRSKVNFMESRPKVGLCVPMLRKKSLSTDDLATRRRPRLFPATPMCLKRPKRNKPIKTTEEIELETIAGLQKQLSEQLRLNELSLRRMRERMPQTKAQNTVQVKATPCFNGPLQYATDSKRSNFRQRAKTAEAVERASMAIRSKFKSGVTHTLPVPSFAKLTANLPKDSKLTDLSQRNVSTRSSSQTESVKTAERLPRRPPQTKAQNNVQVKAAPWFNGPVQYADSESSNCRQRAKTAEVVERATMAIRSKLKNGATPAFPGPSSQTGSTKTAERMPKRPLGLMSHGFHSGVYFAKGQKNTVVKPFSFDRLKETQNSAAAVSEKNQHLPNPQHMKEKAKENVPPSVRAGPSTLQKSVRKARNLI